MNKKPIGQQALYFILITVLLDAIGFGIIIPVMPDLLVELLDIDTTAASTWGGYLSFCYAAMHFLFGPLIGSLSDRFGRRPVLLLSLAALTIDYLILAFAQTIQVLFIGRILTGICGASFATANAYIADVSDEKNRGKAFGMVGAAFGVGFILGPVIGGFLGSIDDRAPFFASAGLALVNMCYGYFVLPESLPKENRRAFSLSRSNPLGAFRQFRLFPKIKWLLVVSFLLFVVHGVYPYTWQYHGKARYGWEPRDIGLSLMAFGICSAVVQGGLIGRVIKRFGERKTAFIGITCGIVAFGGFACATQWWMLYFWIPISACAAATTPAIKAIMSTRVPSNAQGELQGALSSLQGVANMISPIMMTQVFFYFAEVESSYRMFGSAFLLAGCLLAFALVPLIWGTRGLGGVASPEGVDSDTANSDQ